MFERFRDDDLHGVRFALNVFVGATALWLLLRHVAGVNPVWAITAMITAADPVLTDARKDARASLINTTVGCAVGLAVLLAGQPSEWRLPVAISAAVLVSSYFVRIPSQWRQAPITAAIIIGSGLMQHSKLIAVEEGVQRVGEVFLGGVAGLGVSAVISRVWPLPQRAHDSNG